MPQCQQTVPIAKLEFLDLNDSDPVAEQFRTRPVMQVKKTYSRFAALRRLAVIQGGELRPDRFFNEENETIGGGIFFAELSLSDLQNALLPCDLGGWLYLLADVIGETYLWAWAVKVSALEDCEDGAFLRCSTLYKRLHNGFWEVSLAEFEREGE